MCVCDNIFLFKILVTDDDKRWDDFRLRQLNVFHPHFGFVVRIATANPLSPLRFSDTNRTNIIILNGKCGIRKWTASMCQRGMAVSLLSLTSVDFWYFFYGVSNIFSSSRCCYAVENIIIHIRYYDRGIQFKPFK